MSVTRFFVGDHRLFFFEDSSGCACLSVCDVISTFTYVHVSVYLSVCLQVYVYVSCQYITWIFDGLWVLYCYIDLKKPN